MLYIGRHGGVFEIFARGQSKEYFDRLKCLFDIQAKTDFEPLLQAIRRETNSAEVERDFVKSCCVIGIRTVGNKTLEKQ